MSKPASKKRNSYLEKICENLSNFFRQIDKLNENFRELTEFLNGATVHVSDIERILGSTSDDEEEEKENSTDDDPPYLGEKLLQINESLNLSLREIDRSWFVFEFFFRISSRKSFPKVLLQSTIQNSINVLTSAKTEVFYQCSHQYPAISSPPINL